MEGEEERGGEGKARARQAVLVSRSFYSRGGTWCGLV